MITGTAKAVASTKSATITSSASTAVTVRRRRRTITTISPGQFSLPNVRRTTPSHSVLRSADLEEAGNRGLREQHSSECRGGVLGSGWSPSRRTAA
jgi:hypothetical protein